MISVLGLLQYSEERGSKFPRNIRTYLPWYMGSQPIKSYSSSILYFPHGDSLSYTCLIQLNFPRYEGTRWRSWLRHCSTSRKVTGSIPDGVIGIFHWHNPSSRTVALGLTQPVTEISTRNISWGLKALRADNLTTFMCRLSWNLGDSTSWNLQGLSRPVMGLLYRTYWDICYNKCNILQNTVQNRMCYKQF